MGIPSYFASLVKKYPKLISHHPPEIDWLWIDFNCIVYHCLNGLGGEELPPYYGETRKEEWEFLLINIVKKYCKNIVTMVNPKKGVYIAVDGVVPMAKVKQQRMRRFKGGKTIEIDKWDKNAITPGTPFMDKLQISMKNIADSHSGWKFSSSHECGEGEHKIMEQWRTEKYDGNYALYGLDADLVVLSLLNRNNHNVWLFREEMKSREISETFCWFNITRLSDIVFGNDTDKVRKTKDYCFAMSFLGNDFVPSSLSMKIKEGGYQKLISILEETLWKNNSFIVEGDGISICMSSFTTIIKRFAEEEDKRIEQFIKSKTAIIKQPFDNDNEEWKPCKLEEDIITIDGKIVDNWRKKYLQWFGSASELCIGKISEEYLKAVKWAWLYYNGKSVCNNWFYPWNLPPSWKWMVDNDSTFPASDSIEVRKGEISEQEQLCLVLPLKSWNLISNPLLKTLPNIVPWMFPINHGSFCIGKFWKWEEEPKIPIVSVNELRKLISS